MSLQLNPDTTDDYESKTLAQMRQLVFDGLGFITPLNVTPRTLIELRTEIFTRLGFISPLTITGRTLVEIRNSVKNRMGFVDPLVITARTLMQMRKSLTARMGYIDALTVTPRTLVQFRNSITNRLGLALALSANTDSFTNVYNDVYAALGYAGMASAPPGVATLIGGWISQAQSTLLARIEFDWKSTARTPLFTSGNSLIDATPIRMLAIAYGKAHDGSPDATGWSQQVEKYLADITQRTPPNIVGLVNSSIIDAHNTIYERYELALTGSVTLTFGATIVASGDYTSTASDTNTSQVDSNLVELLALANLKAKIGQPDAKDLMGQYDQAITDIAKRLPPNALQQMNSAIVEAHETVYRRFELGLIGPAVTLTFAATIIASGDYSSAASDSDVSQVDSSLVETLAMAIFKEKSGQPDSKPIYAQFEQAIADLFKRSPPNVLGLMNSSIIEAHETVYRRFELGLIGAVTLTFGATIIASGDYASAASDADVSQVDSLVVETLAIAGIKEKLGQPDAKVVYAQFEQYMGDLLKRSPPNANNIINSALLSATETIYRRYAVGNAGSKSVPSFINDADVPAVDDQAVYLLALSNLQNRFGMDDAKQSRADFETYMDELYRRTPPNAASIVNNQLKMTQQTLYRRYDVFRMERWWTWSLVSGQRFYGLFSDDNATSLAPTGGVATIGLAVTSHEMATRRAGHVSITLRNGNVLIAGGTDFNTGAILGSAEIFNPASGSFSSTGPMVSARSGALFAMLSNGDVLVAGGNHGGLLNTAEVYSVATGIWSAVGNMTATHTSGTATVLMDGTVLIVGGTVATHATAIAEVYDPDTATFTATGSLSTARQEHGATLLANGTVLIAGGNNPNSFNTAEIYNPATSAFTAVSGTMVAHRSEHGQILLPSGNVLLAGGVDETSTKLATAEIYSASAGTFSATSGDMATQRASPMITLLSNELVLVAGGQATGSETATADLYSTTSRTFTATGTAMPYANMFANPAALQDGRVLIAGGFDSSGFLSYNTAYFYDPDADLFYLTGNLNQGTVYYQLTAYTANGESLPSPEFFVAAVPANTSVFISWTPVPNQPFVLGYKLYGRVSGGTKQLIITLDKNINPTAYYDEGTIPPDGALPTENNTAGPGNIDPRHVTWVGISFNDNVWNPLIKGISPMLFAQNINGVPTHYEIRQSLEIWPAPTTTDWKVQVKGYFQPQVFESDTDRTTLDWQAIYLQAMADVMPRFRTQKGQSWFNQIELQQAEAKAKQYIGALVAGSHMTAKYVPGAIAERNATRPVLLGPYVGYP